MITRRFELVAVLQSAGGPCRVTMVAALVAFLLAGCLEQSIEKSKSFDKQATVGNPLVLHLEGKPKMGYFWRLSTEKSSGLDLVSLDRLGWTFDTAPRGSGSFTRPGILRYDVRPKKAGSANLVFEYFRKGPGASASASWTYRIDIGHGSAAR